MPNRISPPVQVTRRAPEIPTGWRRFGQAVVLTTPLYVLAAIMMIISTVLAVNTGDTTASVVAIFALTALPILCCKATHRGLAIAEEQAYQRWHRAASASLSLPYQQLLRAKIVPTDWRFSGSGQWVFFTADATSFADAIHGPIELQLWSNDLRLRRHSRIECKVNEVEDNLPETLREYRSTGMPLSGEVNLTLVPKVVTLMAPHFDAGGISTLPRVVQP